MRFSYRPRDLFLLVMVCLVLISSQYRRSGSSSQMRSTDRFREESVDWKRKYRPKCWVEKKAFEHIRVEMVEFSIDCEVERPVLFIEISRLGSKRTVAKTTVLGDGTGHPLNDKVLQLSASKVASKGMWRLTYSLTLLAPASFSSDFSLSWRVEYFSMADALAKHEAPKMSFRGYPLREDILVRCGGDEDELLISTLPKIDDLKSTWQLQSLPNTLARRSWFEVSRGSNAKTCKLQNLQVGKSITILGDSQPTYMCERLKQKRKDLNLECLKAKGVPSQDHMMQKYIDFVKYTESEILAFNFAGLWETAYGNTTGAYERNLLNVLDEIEKNKYIQLVFFITTTAVHPINFPLLPKTPSKWAMTMPRVREVNVKSVSTIQSWQHSGKKSNLIHVIDFEPLSMTSQDDPASPFDMRHYGNVSNDLFSNFMLCKMDEVLA